MPKSAVIDTNVVVSALITGDDSPTVWILNSMLKGEFPFLMSKELLARIFHKLPRMDELSISTG